MKGEDILSLAENLKKLRIANQYSQAELAALTGMTQANISYIEQGVKKNPKWETVVKLANKLNVTPVELLGDSIEQATAEQLVDGQTGG